MPAQEIANALTEALAPSAPFSSDQLSALLLVLAIAVVLLAMGLGYQLARVERRLKALEGAVRATDAAKGAM